MTALQLGFNPAITQTDVVLGPSLPVGDWLTTVIHTSLFTNKRAATDEVPEGATDPQGYWGDSFFSDSSLNSSYGSLLWTLRREKFVNNLEDRVRDMCLDALQWLIRDQHVRWLDVITTRNPGSSRVDIVVQYKRVGMGSHHTVIEQREFVNYAT